MIITIDGPMASGKSSAAHALAKKLGFYYINSGLIFRAIAYSALYKKSYELSQLPVLSEVQLDECMKLVEYCYDTQEGQASILITGVETTSHLKTPEIATAASVLGTNRSARTLIMHIQQAIANKHNCVVEGRDAGSVVFPLADYKFFLTASIQERVKRWQYYQKERGSILSWEQAHEEVIKRDERDSNRIEDPLVVPQDAIVIDNSQLSLNETIEKLLTFINMAGIKNKPAQA